jgi:hypothetical protein
MFFPVSASNAAPAALKSPFWYWKYSLLRSSVSEFLSSSVEFLSS